MALVPLKLEGREVGLHKGFIDPNFGSPNVLTNSPWRYVDLWLRRHEQDSALFYWNQAEHFNKALTDLPVESAPLLLYYSFMNAAKALLSSKGMLGDEYHGIGRVQPVASQKLALVNERLRIKTQGVLPSLSAYYGETETFRVYNLKELLANMSFIHRTYSLTFVSQSEIFFSLVNFKYVFDTDTNSVYFYAKPEKQESKTKARNRLPSSLEVVETDTGFYIRSTASIPWRRPTKATQAEMTALLGLHRELRFDLQYINGTYTLWYAKMNFTRGHSTRRVQRALPTLILAAAHRLSEISPDQLSAFLEGSQNWLLSEFVAMSSDQFIDEIASEITGNQFFVPNVRAPAEPDGE